MKMKTRKAAAKRLQLTATGKVKFKRTAMRHGFANKSASHNLSHRHPDYLSEGHAKQMRRCLPYGI